MMNAFPMPGQPHIGSGSRRFGKPLDLKTRLNDLAGAGIKNVYTGWTNSRSILRTATWLTAQNHAMSF